MAGVVSIQFGGAITVGLIDRLGVVWTLAARNVSAGIVLLLITRPPVRRILRQRGRLVMGFATVITVNGLALYIAIARLPLGVVVAIAFAGPLTLTVVRAHSPRSPIYALLACVGVLLIVDPFGATEDFDVIGLSAAALGALGWAAYLLMSARAGDVLGGTDGLAVALALSATGLLPVALIIGPAGEGAPVLTVAVAAVAVSSTAFPFAMETLALMRLPIGLVGILASTEPAVAAVTGFLVAGQALSLSSVSGISLIVLASVAASADAHSRVAFDDFRQPTIT